MYHIAGVDLLLLESTLLTNPDKGRAYKRNLKLLIHNQKILQFTLVLMPNYLSIIFKYRKDIRCT